MSTSATFHRLSTPLVAVAATWLLLAAPARAADAISPTDGQTVEAQPVFAFDFANGAAEVELSRFPDTRTDGPQAGAFVDQAADDYYVLPRDAEAPFYRRLNAGWYYWHVQTRDDGNDAYSGITSAWGSVRRLKVVDEPAILEGWTLTTRRLRARPGCRHRVQLAGKIAWTDNDETPRVRAFITLSDGGRRRELPAVKLDFSGRYSVVTCPRHRGRQSIELALEDRTGQLGESASRTAVV